MRGIPSSFSLLSGLPARRFAIFADIGHQIPKGEDMEIITESARYISFKIAVLPGQDVVQEMIVLTRYL